MGLLSEKERDDFSWELRFKTTPQLKQMFNDLTAASKTETNSDFTRGQASEKAAMVKTRLNLRNMGGDLG
jgi:hypothetical protein